MTDREAIEALKLVNLKTVHPFYNWEEMLEARDTAISALQEREERNKGCEWCDSRSAVNALHDAIPEANFCPKCGRPLEEIDHD